MGVFGSSWAFLDAKWSWFKTTELVKGIFQALLYILSTASAGWKFFGNALYIMWSQMPGSDREILVFSSVIIVIKHFKVRPAKISPKNIKNYQIVNQDKIYCYWQSIIHEPDKSLTARLQTLTMNIKDFLRLFLTYIQKASKSVT